MLFLGVLLIATLVAALFHPRPPWRHPARWGLAAAMVVAGISHLALPEPFVQHLPEWVPGREPLVAVTGLIEIGLGVALVFPRRWRAPAGLLTASFLVAVFPANVYVAVAGVDVEGQPGGAYPWIRLPLQALFIAWALWSTAPDRERSGSRPTKVTASAPPSHQPTTTGRRHVS
jgi:uncharacterized membrane protein